MSAAFKSRTEPSDFLETSGSMFPSRTEAPSLQELAIVRESQTRELQIVAENSPVEAAIHSHANFMTAVEKRVAMLEEETKQHRKALSTQGAKLAKWGGGDAERAFDTTAVAESVALRLRTYGWDAVIRVDGGAFIVRTNAGEETMAGVATLYEAAA